MGCAGIARSAACLSPSLASDWRARIQLASIRRDSKRTTSLASAHGRQRLAPPRATPPAGAATSTDDADDAGDADEEDDDPRLVDRSDPTPDPLSSPDLWTSMQLASSIYAGTLAIAGAAAGALASIVSSSSAGGGSAAADPAVAAAALLSTLAHGGQLAATVALLRWLGGVAWSGEVVADTEAENEAAEGGQGQGSQRWWWRAQLGVWPAVQGCSAAVVALGLGALVATSSQGADADGVLEWRELLQMAGGGDRGGSGGVGSEEAMSQQAPAAAAAAVAAARFAGAALLAPAWEELYCRGLLMAALRQTALGPGGAAVASGVFFAAALHPPSEFVQQLTLGLVLSASALASGGNLAVPFLGHALYNSGVLVAAAVVR